MRESILGDRLPGRIMRIWSYQEGKDTVALDSQGARTAPARAVMVF